MVYFWKLLNTIYWLINLPFGVVVINSWIIQRWDKVIPRNIGDDINYYLIKKLSGKCVVNFNALPHVISNHLKTIMCIGSIIEWKSSSNYTIIWGSGAMYGGEFPIKKLPHKVYAVRGPKTRDYLLSNGIECPEIYGDPALLLPLIYHSHVKKKYKLGIIPHMYDLENSMIKVFLSQNKEDVTIIDVRNYKKWTDIIDRINECMFIASSSLHGIILSDAYKIPNVWVRFSDKIEGGNFKYQDYFLSVGKNISEPFNLCSNIINIDSIMSYEKYYEEPQISIRNLIDSCPFALSQSMRDKIKSMF